MRSLPLLPAPWALAAALALALSGAPAQAQAEASHAAALQACPRVQQEIVDLDRLVEGLKKSDAVGMLEKLRLKTSIDQLIDRLRAFHAGRGPYTLEQLQEQYDLLMMRVARALQDKDLPLHAQLCNAWDSIWATLQDRRRFTETFT